MKIIAILLIIIGTGFNINNISYNTNNDEKAKETMLLDNINKEDIGIDITNIQKIDDCISLDKLYDSYFIISMDVSNLGLESVELSNINYDVYQDKDKLQTFIQSQDSNLGFVGTLKSGEIKNIKIGLIVENEDKPIQFILKNISNQDGKEIIRSINI